MRQSGLRPVLRRGLWVFLALVALTVLEYVVFLVVPRGNLPYLIVMNLVDAGLILYFFMHISHLWRKEA
ncbi:MAG TPA: cytochrome C oxidase subunit IV family protein [Dehalococcoidia bacterium]|nr:cytochrome C oxidase subunit IV family protein [Dehalococcoidia bacterium]